MRADFLAASCVAVAASLVTVGFVNAAVFPTVPDGSNIWKPGDQVVLTWKDDGKAPALKAIPSLKIEIMTGSDLQQTALATVADNVPGSALQAKWTVPTVDPPGKIYFMRFTGTGAANIWYTTRFVITDANGQYPPPPNPPPPVGKNPGGNGKIVDTPAPAATSGAASGALATPATPATPAASTSPSLGSGTATNSSAVSSSTAAASSSTTTKSGARSSRADIFGVLAVALLLGSLTFVSF